MAVNPDFQGGVTDDPIVNKVVDLIIKRHMQGMEKFGVSMEKTLNLLTIGLTKQ